MVLPLLTMMSGCYLVHERPDLVDASVAPDAPVPRDAARRDAFRAIDTGTRTDAFREPFDAGSGFCPLPGVCENVGHTLMLDRAARVFGDEHCRTLDLELHGSPGDTCESDATERFAITNCLGGFPELTMTVVRAGPAASVAQFIYRAAPSGGAPSCRCGLTAIADVDVGRSLPITLLSGDDEDGVVQYALSGQDVTVRVVACAF
jgi:hypothetical protein